MRNIASTRDQFYAGQGRRVRGISAFVFVIGAVLVSANGCQMASLLSRTRDKAPRVDSAPAALAAIRESRDPGLRRAAFLYLGVPGHAGSEASDADEVTTILGLALQVEPDGQNRVVILESIAKLGSSKWLEAAAPAVNDKDPAVRIALCRLIGRSAAPEAAGKLEHLLISDSSLDVRLAAADALGHIPTHQSAMSLLACIDDSDVAIRYRCRESLKRMTGKDYAGNVDQWREEIQTANFEERAATKRWLGLF